MTFLTLLEVKTRREGVKKSQNRVYVIYGSPRSGWAGVASDEEEPEAARKGD